MEYPFVGVAGNIGVGKTTFTEKIAQLFGWSPFYESVIDNPYLDDFYSDMNRWSFNLQIYFLHHRFRSHQEMSILKSGVIQDRTIYEDVEIFARNLYELHYMQRRDWDNYKNLFKVMTQFLKQPDLIIYLRATTDTLLNRIRGRSRDFEKDISAEYLYKLNLSYEEWINSLNEDNVLVIETDKFNIHKDSETLNLILNQIVNKMSELHFELDIPEVEHPV